jgi:hypothetical protein
MDLIVEMRFGSHLYGTHTPRSDLDLKWVFVPNADDILLQRVESSVTSGRFKPAGHKNAPGDVDREHYSLQRYLELLAEGQTVALEMLFAPDEAMTVPPTAVWREIQSSAHRLVSRRAAVFVRYCRQQANKYGIKGSRIAAAREALELLAEAERRLGTSAKLDAIGPELARLAATVEHVTLRELPVPGDRLVTHLDVCERKIPFTGSIKTGREVVQRLLAQYGERARQAERNEGIDWKALSHAVRVGREAVELFDTGRITLPLPYAAHISRIKRGELPYELVASEIEQLLGEVESAAARSSLPEGADRPFIDGLVARVYRQKVLDGA